MLNTESPLKADVPLQLVIYDMVFGGICSSIGRTPSLKSSLYVQQHSTHPQCQPMFQRPRHVKAPLLTPPIVITPRPYSCSVAQTGGTPSPRLPSRLPSSPSPRACPRATRPCHFVSLKVREHPTKGPFVEGAVRSPVTTARETEQLLVDGQAR